MLARLLRILSVIVGVLTAGIASVVMAVGLCTTLVVVVPLFNAPSLNREDLKSALMIPLSIVAGGAALGLGIYLCQWGLRQRRRDLDARAEGGRK